VCRVLAYCRFAPTQVFTGGIPFRGCSTLMVMSTIAQGKRPPRPTYPTFTENLWALMQRCWDQDPHLRPEVSEALQVLLITWVSRLFRQVYVRELDRSPVCSEDPAWKQLISRALATGNPVSLVQLSNVLSGEEYTQCVPNLQSNDLRWLVDCLDKVYPLPYPPPLSA
jgi:hypothetical protein